MISKNAAYWLAVVALPTVGAAAYGAGDEQKKAPGSRIPVEFIDSEGGSAGSAVLTETANGVLLDARLSGLESGWHGFHVHEHAHCDAPDFKSAGGHYAPRDAAHGFMASGGPHAGDMPNVFVDDDGSVRIQHFLEDVTLHEGEAALLDDDGSAIIVHSGADDYRSQPSGDAGTRVACAKIGGASN